MDEFQRVGVSRASGKALRLCTKCSVEIIAPRPPMYVSERRDPQFMGLRALRISDGYHRRHHPNDATFN
jgi:hypothetical protein